MAAALVHREPGWQLPRRSALARRYDVSMAEIDVAIGELIRRSLIRRLPDGQLYRASPAEYLIPVEGVGGLSTRLDPMGGEISCQARHVSQRDAPQDVAWALGAAGRARSGSSGACGRRGRAGRHLHRLRARDGGRGGGRRPGVLPGRAARPRTRAGAVAAYARAVDLELAPPQPAIARSLRLAPGQPAISLTIRFDDRATGSPVGLTAVALKPDRFRVVIQAGDPLPPSPHPID